MRSICHGSAVGPSSLQLQVGSVIQFQKPVAEVQGHEFVDPPLLFHVPRKGVDLREEHCPLQLVHVATLFEQTDEVRAGGGNVALEADELQFVLIHAVPEDRYLEWNGVR